MSSSLTGANVSASTKTTDPRVVDLTDINSSEFDVIDADAFDSGAIGVNVVDVSATDIDNTDIDATDIDGIDNSCDDPLPDIHNLFAHYNKKYFDSKLNNVYVEFSTRLTLCAGTCTYRGSAGGCRIALSEPLLKFRPSSDLRSTLLHEMIHAHLFNRGISRDGPDGHGPIFMQFANKINSSEPPLIRVTPYHSFEAEVDHYRIHHWKCERCDMLIKRAINRPPGQYDAFWKKHVSTCGGSFIKIAGPTKPKNTSVSKSRVVAMPRNTTRKNLSSLTSKSVPTRRIEDMLSQKPKPSNIALLCPVCSKPVANHFLNKHLDICLAKYSSSDGPNAALNEPSTQAPTTKLPIPTSIQSMHNLEPFISRPSSTLRETETVVQRRLPPSRSGYSARKHLNQQQSEIQPQIPLTNDFDNLAMIAFKPQSFSASHTRQVFASLCRPENPPLPKKRKLSFRELLSPLFRDESAAEREELAKDISSVSRSLSLQTDNPSPKQAHLSDPNSNPHSNPQATPVNAENDGTDSCPICNKVVLRSQLPVHINTCLDQTGLKGEFCDSDQDVTVDAIPDPSRIDTDMLEGQSNCPVCDVVISRQLLERHISQCMTSMGLRDAF